MSTDQSAAAARAEMRRRKILERGAARMDKIMTGSTDPVNKIEPISNGVASVHVNHTNPRRLIELVDDQELDETSFGDDKFGPGIDGILRQDLLQTMGTHPLASLVGSTLSGKSGLKTEVDNLSTGTYLVLITLAIISSYLNTNVWIMEASVAIIIILINSQLITQSGNSKLTGRKIADGCITSFFIFILVQAFKMHFGVKIS